MLPKINADIREIEAKGAFRDLSNAGIDAEDLEPFIELIQNTEPSEGIVAELEEGLDEFLASGGDPREIVEGGLEVGEVAIRETGEFAVDRFNDARGAVESINNGLDWVTGGRWPF